MFCDELKKDFSINYEVLTSENTIESPKCPKCIEGRLVRRIDKYKNEFVGCDNYPMCDFTYKSVEIFNRQVTCNKCGSYMIKRKAKGRYFWGCVNYPYCRNTKEYSKNTEDEAEVETAFMQDIKPKYMYVNKLIERYGEEDAINVAKDELLRLQSKGIETSSKARELKSFISMKENSCREELDGNKKQYNSDREVKNKWKRLYEDNVVNVDDTEIEEDKLEEIYEEYYKDMMESNYDNVFHKLTKSYPDIDELL